MSTDLSESTYRNKEWLTEQYITNNLFLKDIAKKCDASIGTIQSWVSKFKLHKKIQTHFDYRNKEWLYNEYVVKNKSRQEIADNQGVYFGTIERWLRRFGITKLF